MIMLRGGLLLITFVALAVGALRYDGENVCSKTEERIQKYIVEVKKRVAVIKEVRCWDVTQNFLCKRKVYEDRLVPEEKTKVVHVPLYFCCPGCNQDGDKCVKQIAAANHWTVSSGGCQCYFNMFQDCACCVNGGCQCGYEYPDRCVQCGYGHMCHPSYDEVNKQGVDAWTFSESGCACDGSGKSGGDCPCCQNRGCQCKEGNTKRCTQCGLPEACNLK